MGVLAQESVCKCNLRITANLWQAVRVISRETKWDCSKVLIIICDLCLLGVVQCSTPAWFNYLEVFCNGPVKYCSGSDEMRIKKKKDPLQISQFSFSSGSPLLHYMNNNKSPLTREGFFATIVGRSVWYHWSNREISNSEQSCKKVTVMILILHFPLIITTLVLFQGKEAFMAESQTFYLSYAPCLEVLQNRGNGKIYV